MKVREEKNLAIALAQEWFYTETRLGPLKWQGLEEDGKTKRDSLVHSSVALEMMPPGHGTQPTKLNFQLTAVIHVKIEENKHFRTEWCGMRIKYSCKRNPVLLMTLEREGAE